MDLQIHHHIRHTFRDIQVLPESLLRIAGMHENGMPAKICSEVLCFSLLPPLGRTFDSQRASGRIFMSCIRPVLAGRILLVVHGGERRHISAVQKIADTYSPRRQALSVLRHGVGADGCPVACFSGGWRKKI